jgi:5'-3' exonuclease
LTTALIDGDEAIYKATVIKVEETDWESEDFEASVVSRPPTFQEALEAFNRIVEAWVREVDADDYIICLSPKERGLFRRGIYPAYKSARGEKPEQYKPVEDFVFEHFNPVWYPGLEADDVMGILSGPGKIICSNDKDMKTIPGMLYITGKKTLVEITPSRANYQWMYQTLTGDSTDGFKGCTGIGPKKADGALTEAGTSLPNMARAAQDLYLAPKTGKYRDQPQDLSDFRREAVLARILRPTDYDIETGRVRYAIPGVKDIDFNARDKAR